MYDSGVDIHLYGSFLFIRSCLTNILAGDAFQGFSIVVRSLNCASLRGVQIVCAFFCLEEFDLSFAEIPQLVLALTNQGLPQLTPREQFSLFIPRAARERISLDISTVDVP